MNKFHEAIIKFNLMVYSVFESFWKDLAEFYASLNKPSKIIDIFFYVILILFVSEKYFQLKIALWLFFLLYVWKTGVVSGRYKEKFRELQLKKLNQKYSGGNQTE